MASLRNQHRNGANPKVSAAPRVGIRARLGKPFAQRGEASNGAVQTKSLETIYKQALSSGKLNMSNRNMVHVPLQDFLNVASSGVDGVNFWEVIDLKHIDLSHNSISQMTPEGVLTNFRSLETLNVQNNMFTMTSFPFESLANLECLRSLNLSNLQLTGAIPACLGHCINLVELNVSQNKVTNIDCVATLESLHILNASHNCIGPIVPSHLPKALMRIELSNNKLVEMSRCFGSLIHLENLDLSDNKISAINCTLVEARPLRVLNLRGNQLQSIPVLPKNGVLDTILMGSNQLKELNVRCLMGSAGTLCVLDLSRNKLRGLPHDLGMFGNLKTLDLANNDLTSLPPSIGWIRSLQRLTLEGNAIRSIRRNILDGGAEALKKYLRSRGAKHESLRIELAQVDNNDVIDVNRQRQRLGERKIIQSFERMFD